MSSQDPSQPADRRLIKRYANRKLYDTRDSRYVTLRQIAEMVRAGDDVQVIDNNSKEDLTSLTLAQVIYGQEKTSAQHLPSTLKDLIHTSGERLMASIREGRVGRLILRDGATNSGTEEASGAGGAEVRPEPSEESRASGLAGLVEASRDTLEDWQKRLDDRVRASLAGWRPFVQLQGDVRRLSQQIDELEKKLKGLARRGRGDKDGSDDPKE